ncbi:MAG: TetR family transcriptional regulator C-terminal domain-containing protein [Acidiferrobacterales bacterium]
MFKRAADQTRELLLHAAFDEMQQHGFQAAGLSRILANTGLTKGALYHHFSSKIALGYAVVDELVKQEIEARWLTPLEGQQDPIAALIAALQREAKAIRPTEIIRGCPLNNLAQEMSPVDEGFRQRINQIYNVWRAGLATALRRGQQNNTVRQDICADDAAAFIVATLEGCIGMAKNARDPALLLTCGKGLVHYLQSLRP